jgi:glycosyltransferase involved in cell wall biosynthesis
MAAQDSGMHLDVIIPTYNRDELLPRALQSLAQATVPAGLTVGITIVDNNSSDNTRLVTEQWQSRFTGSLQYVFEKRQGRSYALNTGIASTQGDLVGFVDDDEEVDKSWFECIHHAFSSWNIDFLGGPYVPKWESEPPNWLPAEYCGVVGNINGGDEIATFDESYPGILMGGNAVLTRAIINKVGLYLTSVGRSGQRLLAGEDEDMYRRLLAANARGIYFPSLKVFHYVPQNRMTRGYFRKWCFWRGVSRGVLDHQRPLDVAYLCGVPRYLYGKAARGLWRNLLSPLRRPSDPSKLFADRLATLDLIGYFYGKHFYSPEDQS